MSWLFNENAWRDASSRVLLFLPQLAVAIVLLAIFWGSGVFVERLLCRVGESRKLSADAMFVLARAAKLTLQITGLITVLGTLGVNVTALVAGLGLTGFALGFALKDIISNLLAGIIILMYKPFRHSDRITVQTSTTPWLEGVVGQIDLRYTTLELPDRKYLNSQRQPAHQCDYRASRRSASPGGNDGEERLERPMCECSRVRKNAGERRLASHVFHSPAFLRTRLPYASANCFLVVRGHRDALCARIRGRGRFGQPRVRLASGNEAAAAGDVFQRIVGRQQRRDRLPSARINGGRKPTVWARY